MINEDIIARAQRGDQQAFQQLVEAYHGIVWRTARILLRDSALTEDVVQEAWIDAWRGLPRLQNPHTLRSWLLTVVTNRCRMALRRSVPVTISLECDPDVLVLPGEIEDTLERLVRQETSANIRTVLEDLPVEQQSVLALRYFAELELSEIALVTSLPLGTIKSRLHRALHTLRALLQVKKEKLWL